MAVIHNITDRIINLFSSKDKKAVFTARQYALAKMPLSKAVELYLYDNDGCPQNLDKFPMMRDIYDTLPQRLLLKCSRKTLKSTLLSNIIALNMLRFNYYNMLYVGPQEATVKLFSSKYLTPRFNSPAIKKILNGFDKDDVFEKQITDTKSSVILRFAKDDATRIRGPATAHNIHDEVQDISWEILPIIAETMAISDIKREYYAGTPLTTDNTLNKLWKTTNQLEWATKCEGCNHWNMLIEENDPMSMILAHGFSCSKCSKILNTANGIWVAANPSPEPKMIGYHMAQPMLPHYNQSTKQWKKIYEKVTDGNYHIPQIFNEVFGLPYDAGTKWLSELDLRNACTLGPMVDIFDKNRERYIFYTVGADWGVNMRTSRTAACFCGVRSDGIIEVFFQKIYKDFNYNDHIKDIANRANGVNAYVASDGGPDPNRAIMLAEMTSPERTQIVSYAPSPFIQSYRAPTGSISWKQNRWVLHRTDTISFVGNLIKSGKILFPRWEDCSEAMQDIINVYIETREGLWKQEMFYRHNNDAPDDFVHALNFAVVQAHFILDNPLLSGFNSGHSTEAAGNDS